MLKLFLEIAAILGLTGLVTGWAQEIPKKLIARFNRRRYVEFTVETRSSALSWLNNWIDEHRLWGSSPSVLIGHAHRNTKKDYSLSLGGGDHEVVYKGVRMLFSKSSSKDESGAVTETMSIKVKTHDRDAVVALLAEAKDLFDYGDGYSVMQIRYDSWEVARREPLRSLRSVVLPADKLEAVMNDAVTFFDSEKWYADRGLPYRRGYLFAGVPGSGKSTLVSCLASSLKKNVYWIDLLRFESDSALYQAMSQIPSGSIVLIEDIDAAIQGREVKTTDVMKHVSFTGLINALDSMIGCRGSIVILTTNHPEKLDHALVRPGRIDMRVDFENATAEQAAILFERFYGVSGHRVRETFVDGSMSMAALQALFVEHRNDPGIAVQKLLQRAA